MTREIFIVGFLVFLIGAVAGFLARPFLDDPLSLRNASKTEQLLAKRFPFISANTSIQGEIKEVYPDYILLDVFGYNPIIIFGSGKSRDTRKVLVSSDTKIQKISPKNQELFAKDQEDFQRKYAAYSKEISAGKIISPPIRPSLNIETPVALEFLTPGMLVSVESKEPPLLKREFSADIIIFNSN